jgi:hypothetical protein
MNPLYIITALLVTLAALYWLCCAVDVWAKSRKAQMEDTESRIEERNYHLLLTHIEKAVRAAEAVAPPVGSAQAYLSGEQKKIFALSIVKEMFPDVPDLLVEGLIESELSYLENGIRGDCFTRVPKGMLVETMPEETVEPAQGE